MQISFKVSIFGYKRAAGTTRYPGYKFTANNMQ